MPKYNLIPDLWKTIQTYPQARWDDALSSGQVQSKLWLIETAEPLLPPIHCAFICAGWYGLLAGLWKQRETCPIKKFRSFDRDPFCAPVADQLHRQLVIQDWQFKASTHDIYDLNYAKATYNTVKADGSTQALVDQPDLIINTSCEHLPDIKAWYSLIPQGTWVILQNNNFLDSQDHKSCAPSLDAFSAITPMTNRLFAGTLDLKNYKRFMLIGKK